jgi:hypothetical protein
LTSASSITPTLLTPPQLGLVTLRINGFAALKPIEQLQAATLALHRDLSVGPTGLRLAAQPAQSPDEAKVAFCAGASAATTHLATGLLAAMQPGKVYWVDAPSGYVVGERGAASVDIPSSQHDLPSVVAATLAGIGVSSGAQCILVNRDRSVVTDERISWWSAASGVTMVDGALPKTTPVQLVAPPRHRVRANTTALDRALMTAAIASVVCVLLAGLRLVNQPSLPPAAGTSKTLHASAGALLDRVGTITPELVGQMQAATYASGAWVLTLPDTFAPETLKRAASALEANGLAVQTTNAPGPRIRVQLP